MENVQSENEFTKQDKKKLFRNIIIAVLLIITACVILLFPDLSKVDEPVVVEFSAVDHICELATLECYYHDVAEYEKQPDGLFKYGLFKYGYKKLWMEYNGIVTIGIDVNNVQVNKPDENGVVRIYVPDARVMDVDVDEYSMSEPVVDSGVLTTITTEEKAVAFSEAQKTMRENAENDNSILEQAKRNAKALIKQYIIQVGEQYGQQYAVEWLDAPYNKVQNQEENTNE